MGLKLSCIHGASLSRQVQQPARVITTDGSLKELPASRGVPVSDLLDGDTSASFFVCNSDALYFNEHPRAMGPGELLRPGQIYFLLQAAMLRRPLSTSDMGALAARASAALASCKLQRGKKKVRVMPVREDDQDDVDFVNEKLNKQTLGEFGVLLSPARSNGKLAAAARLKRALSIVQEDADIAE